MQKSLSETFIPRGHLHDLRPAPRRDLGHRRERAVPPRPGGLRAEHRHHQHEPQHGEQVKLMCSTINSN